MRACRVPPFLLQGPRRLPSPLLSLTSSPPLLSCSLRCTKACHTPSLLTIPIRTAWTGISRGDWLCGRCDIINFSKRTECNSCGGTKAEVQVAEYEEQVTEAEIPTIIDEISKGGLPKNHAENKLCALIMYKNITLEQARSCFSQAISYPIPKTSRFYKRAAKVFSRLKSMDDLVAVVKYVDIGSDHSGEIFGILVVMMLMQGNIDASVAILKKMSAYKLKIEKPRLVNIYHEAAKIPNGLSKLKDANLSFGDDAILMSLLLKQNLISLPEAVEAFKKTAPKLDIVVATQLLFRAISEMDKAKHRDSKADTDLQQAVIMTLIALVSENAEHVKTDSQWYLGVVHAMRRLESSEQLKPLWDAIRDSKADVSADMCIHMAKMIAIADLEEIVWDMIEKLDRKATVKFFEILVGRFAEVGKLDLTSALINKMTSLNRFPNDSFVSTYVAALSRPGTQDAADGAEVTMRNMVSQGFTLAAPAYENLIATFLQLKQFDKAAEIMIFGLGNTETKDQEGSLFPKAYNTLLMTLINENQKELVLSLYKALPSGQKLSVNAAREFFKIFPELKQTEENFEAAIKSSAQPRRTSKNLWNASAKRRVSNELPPEIRTELQHIDSSESQRDDAPRANTQGATKENLAERLGIKPKQADANLDRLHKKYSDKISKPQESLRPHGPGGSPSSPALPLYATTHPLELLRFLQPPTSKSEHVNLSALPPPPSQFVNPSLNPPLPHHFHPPPPPPPPDFHHLPPNSSLPNYHVSPPPPPPTQSNVETIQIPHTNELHDKQTTKPYLQFSYKPTQQATSSQPSDSQSPDTQSSNVQSSNAQLSNTQPSNVQSSEQSSNVQPSHAEPSNASSPNVQPSNTQPSNAQSSYVQSTNLRSTNAQPPNMQTTFNSQSPNMNKATSFKKDKRKKFPQANATTPQTPFTPPSGVTPLPITIRQIKQDNAQGRKVTVVNFGAIRLYDHEDIKEFGAKYSLRDSYLKYLNSVEKLQTEAETEESKEFENLISQGTEEYDESQQTDQQTTSEQTEEPQQQPKEVGQSAQIEQLEHQTETMQRTTQPEKNSTTENLEQQHTSKTISTQQQNDNNEEKEATHTTKHLPEEEEDEEFSTPSTRRTRSASQRSKRSLPLMKQ